MQDRTQRRYLNGYLSAISLNSKRLDLSESLQAIYNINVTSTELLDDYPVLLDLSNRFQIPVRLLLRGDRLIAEKFVELFKPELPVMWTPITSEGDGELQSSQSGFGYLDLWIDRNLRYRFFSPLPSLEELGRVVSNLVPDLSSSPEKSRVDLLKSELIYDQEIVDLCTLGDGWILSLLVYPGELYVIDLRTGKLIDERRVSSDYIRCLSAESELILWAPLRGSLARVHISDDSKEDSYVNLAPGTTLNYQGDLPNIPRYIIGKPGYFQGLDEEETYVHLAGSRRMGFLDGRGASAKLSWPLASDRDGILLFFADSFNHSLRVLNLITREIRTISGRGEVGIRDGSPYKARFSFIRSLVVENSYLLAVEEELMGVRVINRRTGYTSSLFSDELDSYLTTTPRIIRRSLGFNEYLLSDGRTLIRAIIDFEERTLKVLDEVFKL